MGHTTHLEPQPVVAVGIQGGAIAAGRPTGEIEESLFILVGRGRKSEKPGTDGAGIDETEAGEQTLADAGRIDRSDDEPALLVADQGQRPVIG